MAALNNAYSGDPWSQQPGETDTMFARFEHYLLHQSPGKRTFAATAEHVGVDRSTIAHNAKQHRWRERAKMWDDHRATTIQESILARDVELADRLMDDARIAESILRRSLAGIAQEQLTFNEAKELVSLAKLTVELRDAAKNRPDQVISLVNGIDADEDTPESLEGLSPEQRRDRVAEMARGLLHVVDGGRAS